jgi:hypothetical protein
VLKLLKRAGLDRDIDIVELNEAFASQVVYCRDRPASRWKLNPNGGSIAISHPYGTTAPAWSARAPRVATPEEALDRHCGMAGRWRRGLFEAAL